MESQPQNPEFRINPENFHPCIYASCKGSDDPVHLPSLVSHSQLPRTQVMKYEHQ